MIAIKHLTHRYDGRDEDAVNDVSLSIAKGERVVILGASGSGKSTLLKCINRLVEPQSGSIEINGEDILKAKKQMSERIRGKIGMIFQNFNLLERETVLANVLNGRLRFNSALRAVFGMFSKQDYHEAEEQLKRVGLEGLSHERVSNLSGGQKQRVAIARALCQKPDVILGDEPVSSLDPKLMKEIMDLITSICIEENITVITCLHFLDFAKKYASRIVGINKGSIVFDGKPGDLTEKDIVEIYGKTRDWYIYGRTGY